jgi:exonuclease SbcC
MDKLKDLKYDENCKFCMDNVFVKDAIQTRASIESEQDKIKQLEQEISKIEEKIKEHSSFETKLEEYSSVEKQINNINITVLKIENEIKSLENALSKLNSTKETLVKNISDYIDQEGVIKDNEMYKLELDSIKEKQNKVKAKEKEIDLDYTNLEVKKSLLKKEIEACEESMRKMGEYEKNKRLYQHYLDCIHRDGIPHMFISQTLPQIQDEVNSILSQLVDFRVILSADHKNINGYIAYAEDRVWGIELVSGMEKFITSLAIRCALISVSSLPRPNFIFIDEGFGALDKDNLSSVVSLFEYLKSQFQFTAIISHIESMRDMVDSIIDITKKDGISKIQHG